jgi:UDP-4-amino-4-deoxy-L-arabinose formyltransferase/UDP-glucuronic acid dehydrogenase (UDP-4-keto-hexauronic acid decarboxylating)
MSRARWVVFAYHSFGARALEALLSKGEQIVAVITHPDDPSEAGWFESVAEIARIHRLPVFTPSSPNLSVIVGMLKALSPDLLLSVWYRRLLGADLLALPRIAALNLHGSLLPAYRGRAPVNWVLVNGERVTGVTLHHMNLEADAGDIVAQEPIEITPDDTAFTLYKRMIKVGVELLLESYPAVIAGSAPRIPQDHTRATIFPRRRPEDGRVQWGWPTERIANMIRAVTHPYPGAFVGDEHRCLYLWAGSVRSGDRMSAQPGTLLEILPSEGMTVATGCGTLLLSRIQGAGVAEESADLWALRRGLRPGDRIELEGA